jgi:hypothetical protein
MLPGLVASRLVLRASWTWRRGYFTLKRRGGGTSGPMCPDRARRRTSSSRSWRRPQAGRYCPPCRRLTFPGKGAPVKDRTEAFDRLVCERGAPCRSHEDPAVTPSVQQATRARRATRHQDRQDQLVAEKERRTVGPSPLLPRPAVENLLTAPLGRDTSSARCRRRVELLTEAC